MGAQPIRMGARIDRAKTSFNMNKISCQGKLFRWGYGSYGLNMGFRGLALHLLVFDPIASSPVDSKVHGERANDAEGVASTPAAMVGPVHAGVAVTKAIDTVGACIDHLARGDE